MSKYPKGGYVDAGQAVTVARDVINGVINLPELRVAWYSVAPDAKDTDGILTTVSLAEGLEEHEPDGQPDIARQLIVTGDADSEGAVVIIDGYDVLGNSLSEDVTVPGVGDSYAAVTNSAFAEVETVTVAHSEVYTLALDTPSGGTFKLGNDTDGWTEDIAHDATKTTIETALEAVYGEGVVAVADDSDFDITFDAGIAAALELDATSLSDAAAASVTLATLGDVKVGLDQGVGLPSVADAPSTVAVYWDGAVLAPGTWGHTVDATDGDVAQNIIDPGDTAGSAYDGAKVLDVYFSVAAVREE